MNNKTSHDSVYQLPGWKIAKAIKNGDIAAREIAQIFLQRINELNPLLKSWVHLNEEYLLSQADKVDKKKSIGMLAGVPIGVKDIFNTEILPTEMGSPIWKGHKAGNDARCVSYLRRDDGIIAGKTDTAEFAVHTPGHALNPWNTDHATGTSSGGSASAVATAMVPMALATQTAGSTIRPASWCGVYGMKPSFGLIPRTGVLKTTDTLDNVGFYGRDVKDLHLLLDCLRVHGDNFPIMEKRFADFTGKPKNKWRVGFVRGHLWNEAPEYTKEAMVLMASELDVIDGIDVVELELPESTYHAHGLHRRIYNPCLSYYFREEIEDDPELISDMFMNLVKDGDTISPDDYKYALKEQVALSEEIEGFYKSNQVDVLIHHSSNGSAPLVEPVINLDMNLLWTLAWLPVVNIPQFQCPNGLPYGLQVIGSRYSDYRLFDFIEYLIQQGVIPEIAPIAESPFIGNNRGS